MISRDLMARELARFAECCRMELTEAMVVSYHDDLAEDFTQEQWAATCKHLRRTLSRWPTPADFLATLEQHEQDEAATEAEAAWAAIYGNGKCRRYQPEGGEKYALDLIESVVGAKAAQAFRCSSAAAILNRDHQPREVAFVRRDFLDAYNRLTRGEQDEAAGLLPDGAQLTLPRAEAQKLMSKLEADAEAAKSKPRNTEAAKRHIDNMRDVLKRTKRDLEAAP